MTQRKQLVHSLFIAVVVAVIAYSVVSTAVNYQQGDPRGSLLVSQTIVQEGTIKLDSHADLIPSLGYRIREKNGHVYYYFPIGSALYSVPFVAMANALGQDMRVQYDENRLQLAMAAFLGVATFLLLYFIARTLIGEPSRSLLLAALFWFGSGYCSTSATALFSHNWATVTSLLAILLVTRACCLERSPQCVLIGFFLFSAYLCRPTLALLAPVLILFLFTVNRVAAVKVAAAVFVLLALFVCWSFFEFGQPLPDYYLPERLGDSRFGEALPGNLFSPSRGLFVFMPYLLVPFIFWRRSLAVLRENKRVLIVLAWPVIHLLSISSFSHWWGGYSFGPRLMLDAVPAFFLFYCLFARDLPVGSWAARGILVTGLLAVYINWYQGLFNVYSYQWNVQPGVDQHPGTIWDWRFPQFLHSEERHNRREREFMVSELSPLTPGETLGFDSDRLAFVGWHDPWPGLRWSRGGTSEIYFRVEQGDTYRGVLQLRVGFQGRQRVAVALNGAEVAVIDGAGQAPLARVLRFDPALLTSTDLNVIRFQFSDATEPARGQHFHLAMALESLLLN